LQKKNKKQKQKEKEKKLRVQAKGLKPDLARQVDLGPNQP